MLKSTPIHLPHCLLRGNMSARRLSLILTAVFEGLSLTAVASAQANVNYMDTGLQAYHQYQGGNIDNVNLDNGSLTVTIPLLSYPQRGSTLTLNYNIISSASKVFQE